MSDVVYLGRNVDSLEMSPAFDSYECVKIYLDEKDTENVTVYQAGDDSRGRTLELVCPWGTQEMAENILAAMKGVEGVRSDFIYRPYTATSAQLDPAAELGDGIAMDGLYSGLFSQREVFGRSHISDISSPTEEEIDHEYPYETSEKRQTERRYAQIQEQMRSQFSVLSNSIAAKVEQVGGDNKSFGWELTADGFVIYSQNTAVMKVDSTGLTVTGTIKSNGDDPNIILNPNGTAKIGLLEIQNGSATFDGYIYARNLQDYVKTGNIDNGAITTAKINDGQVTSEKTASGVQTSLSRAESAYESVGKFTQVITINTTSNSMSAVTGKFTNLDVSSILTYKSKSVQVEESTGYLKLYGY